MKSFICFLILITAFEATAQQGRRPRGERVKSAGFERVEASEVPQEVQSAFSSANPGVTSIQWEKHEVKGANGKDFTKYVARYQTADGRARARFKQDGTPLSSSRYLKAQSLPSNIQSVATAKNPGFTLIGGEQLTTRKGETYYRVRMRKGASKMITLYDSNGAEVNRDRLPDELQPDEGDEG